MQSEDMKKQQIIHGFSGLQDRINLLEARILVQKDDLRRMSNTISEQAAEIHKITAQQEIERIWMNDFDVKEQITKRRLDELFPERLNHHLRLLKLEENNAI